MRTKYSGFNDGAEDDHAARHGHSSSAVNDSAAIPADDPRRQLAVARPDQDDALPHLGIVGDTYTILLTGEDTAGRYTLIDMHVPPGGGPPPHRHDFEEMFTVLEGEVELTFRGEHLVARAGETVNVLAERPARLHQRRQPARAAAVRLRPGRAGELLPRDRRAGRHPDRATRTARRGRPGGVHCKIPGPSPAIPDRIAATLNRAGGTSTEDGHGGRC